MAICDDCFQEFLHPLVHELMDKNESFRNRYGLHARWDWDADSATLTFTDPVKPTLRIKTSVVGTMEDDQWEWTWANRNFESHTKRDIEQVRAYGEKNSLEPLTSAFLDADEHTGWEMTAIAAHLLQAPGAYRFPTDRGFCYVLYREIDESEPTGEVLDADSNASS